MEQNQSGGSSGSNRGVDHSVLREKCRKAFGTKIPMAAKDQWATFIREERTEFYFRYEWIRDPRLFQWVSSRNDLEIHDGQEWYGVYICTPEGKPLNKYD